MRVSSTTAIAHQRHRVVTQMEGLCPTLPKGRVVVTTTIGRRGRITVGPIAPENWGRVAERVMALMTAISRDGPIADAGCLDPQRAEAMAQRLADRILRGAA